MAQVDCVGKSDIEVLHESVNVSDAPNLKKFKQVRLPFKPLDHGSQVQGTSPGGKKRKLSDNESPSAKQMKTSAGKEAQKHVTADCDPEVSSSSEAESKPAIGFKKGGSKVNTLDSFFKPRKVNQDEQGEISSTIDCIDITDDKSDESCQEKSDRMECQENSMETEIEIINDSQGDMNNEDLKNRNDGESESIELAVLDDSDDDNKENKDLTTAPLDQSFISDISVCEDALKTPAKSKDVPFSTVAVDKEDVTSAVEKTVEELAGSTTPTLSAKQKKTPGSLARKQLSESKKKEKEEQRLKREKELEEKRLQKQKEKEEKERVRLEKKKQKEQEKLEKEKIKLEEKEKKDQERLEKLKQKEEEKKQKEKEMEAKLEAKMEEKKKKEEEKRQKEEEKKQKEEEKRKEEEEKMKKEEKKKESFKKFFIQKTPAVSPPKPTENTKKSFFMPFEVKPNMKLAPQHRVCLMDDQKAALDDLISNQTVEDDFLKGLKKSTFVARNSSKTWPRNLNEEKDVELLSHDMDVIEKVTHRAKFLCFHENTRPPYYGTWRKKSSKLTPRNPFKQDEELFDYEVDSDDEWEEEEPGESVSSDEEEDEDKEKEEDDEECDDWMVPHGYLSDGEGIDDEEEVDNASKQDLQKIRQAAWESELKRQAKPLRMIAIGCVWDNDGTANIAAQQLEMLLKFKAVCLREDSVPTSHSGLQAEGLSSSEKSEKNDDKSAKSRLKKSVPEEAIPDLIRLLHGNPSGLKNLVKEFRMYWKLKTNPSVPENDTALSECNAMELDDKSEKVNEETPRAGESRSKMEEEKLNKVCQETPKPADSKAEAQDDFAISKRQLWIKIPAIAVREKRPEHKKMCWYVHSEVLQQYNMEDISLPNTWKYVCVKEPTWAEEKEKEKEKTEEGSNITNNKIAPTTSTPSGRATPTIMQFAQPMTLSKIQAIGMSSVSKEGSDESKEKVTSCSNASEEVTVTPIKPSLPPDQKTIKDMFTTPKARKDILSPTSTKLSQQNKVLCTKGSPRISAIKLEPGLKSNENHVIEVDNDMEIDDVMQVTGNNEEKSIAESEKNITTPKTSGHEVLRSILSSPDLMKTSPDNNKKVKEHGKNSKAVENVEEMEIDDDVIVLD